MSVPETPPSGSSGAIPLWVAAPAAPVERAAQGQPQSQPVSHGRSPGPARWDDRGARLRKSSTSFGLTGRVVITVILLAVLAMIAFGNILGVPVYLVVLVWALRDLWAPARRPSPTPPRRPLPAGRSAVPDRPWASSAYDGIPRAATDAAPGAPPPFAG